MARKQHVPWRAAGTASEAQASADDVVRETGWVFNNVTGDDLNLAEFVSTGDHEVGAFLKAFDLPTGHRRLDRRDRLGHRPDDGRRSPRSTGG